MAGRFQTPRGVTTSVSDMTCIMVSIFLCLQSQCAPFHFCCCLSSSSSSSSSFSFFALFIFRTTFCDLFCLFYIFRFSQLSVERRKALDLGMQRHVLVVMVVVMRVGVGRGGWWDGEGGGGSRDGGGC